MISQGKIAQIVTLSGLVLSLVLFSGGLGAQDTRSAVSGTITDEEGSPVGGAEIVVRHLETGRTWSLLTGSEGVYFAPGLPPGSYVIEASAVGFKMALTGVHFKNPREVVLDLKLQPEENGNREQASTPSREPKPKERGDSPPSRATREDASRSSGEDRLESPADFPPVDRGSSASPLAEPPATRPAQAAAEFPPVDRQSSASPLSEPPATRQGQPAAELPPVDRGSSVSPPPEPPVTRQAQPAAELPTVDPGSSPSPPPEPQATVRVLPATVQMGGFVVQMAAFRKPEPAEGFRGMLEDRGYAAYVAEVDIPGSGVYYRVRVGPYGTQEEVAVVVADMQESLPKPLPDFWILPADR